MPGGEPGASGVWPLTACSINGRPRCLSGFGDLAGPNAGGAHAKRLAGSIDQRVDAAQVGIPAATGDVVSVTNAVSVRGTFPANLANTSHKNSL